jgi:hypothetical protein
VLPVVPVELVVPVLPVLPVVPVPPVEPVVPVLPLLWSTSCFLQLTNAINRQNKMPVTMILNVCVVFMFHVLAG